MKQHRTIKSPPVPWRRSDGSQPDLSCYACGRRTPKLIQGLGFDCCAPAAANDDLGPMRIDRLAILIGASLGIWAVVILAAIKAWLTISATVAGWFA